MPAFSAEVTHALGREQATVRLKAFLEHVRLQHADKLADLRGQWSESTLAFAFTTYGMAIQGTMVVEEAAVQVVGTLPLAAAFFRGQIEQTLRQELLRLLGEVT